MSPSRPSTKAPTSERGGIPRRCALPTTSGNTSPSRTGQSVPTKAVTGIERSSCHPASSRGHCCSTRTRWRIVSRMRDRRLVVRAACQVGGSARTLLYFFHLSTDPQATAAKIRPAAASALCGSHRRTFRRRRARSAPATTQSPWGPLIQESQSTDRFMR